MSLVLKLNATQSGGTDTSFVDQGAGNANQRVFMSSTSTLTDPRLIKATTRTSTGSLTKPGQGRSEVLFVLSNTNVSETCCTTKSGAVTFRLNVDWPLDQPSSLVDEGIKWLQGLAYSGYLSDLIKKGVVAA